MTNLIVKTNLDENLLLVHHFAHFSHITSLLVKLLQFLLQHSHLQLCQDEIQIHGLGTSIEKLSEQQLRK